MKLSLQHLRLQILQPMHLPWRSLLSIVSSRKTPDSIMKPYAITTKLLAPLRVCSNWTNYSTSKNSHQRRRSGTIFNRTCRHSHGSCCLLHQSWHAHQTVYWGQHAHPSLILHNWELKTRHQRIWRWVPHSSYADVTSLWLDLGNSCHYSLTVYLWHQTSCLRWRNLMPNAGILLYFQNRLLRLCPPHFVVTSEI